MMRLPRPGLKPVLLLVGGALLLTAGALSPRALRRMDAFRVRQVEVRGTRYLAPSEVLAAAGIDANASVWDDSGVWIGSLRRHPLVRDARIERRLPSTLRITITETEPVALVRTPTLVPVDAAGRVLPIAPDEAGLDLPVVAGPAAVDANGRLEDARLQAALAAYDALRASQPELSEIVSELGAGDGVLRLLLRTPQPAIIALPETAAPARLRELRTALDDVARRGELRRLRVLDARFRDQVVVSLYPSETI